MWDVSQFYFSLFSFAKLYTQITVGITVPPDGMVGCPGIGNEDLNEEYPATERRMVQTR